MKNYFELKKMETENSSQILNKTFITYYDYLVEKSKEICRLSNQVINLHKLNLEAQKLENLGDVKELHEFFRESKNNTK